MRARAVTLSLAMAAAVPLAHGAAAAQTTAPAPPSAPTSQLLARVQSRYGAAKTYEADFALQHHVKAYNQSTTAHGHVVFARNGATTWTLADGSAHAAAPDALAFLGNLGQ